MPVRLKLRKETYILKTIMSLENCYLLENNNTDEYLYKDNDINSIMAWMQISRSVYTTFKMSNKYRNSNRYP